MDEARVAEILDNEKSTEILEAYRARISGRIQGLKDDLMTKTEHLTKEELVCEFAKWAKVALICEMEDMINAK